MAVVLVITSLWVGKWIKRNQLDAKHEKHGTTHFRKQHKLNKQTNKNNENLFKMQDQKKNQSHSLTIKLTNKHISTRRLAKGMK